MSFRDRRQFLTQAGMAALVAALPRSTLALQSAPASGGRFPEGFFWGASTSAAQSEGSPLADSGGESLWDVVSTDAKSYG